MTAGLAVAAGLAGLAAGPLLNRAADRASGTRWRWRPPAVNVASCGLLALLALRFGAQIALGAYCALAAGLVVISAADLEARIVPRRILYPTLAAGAALLVAASVVEGRPGLAGRAALWGAGCLACFVAVHLVVPRGLGFGDVRLAGVVGAFLGWLGPPQVLAGMLAAFVLASASGGVLLALGKIGTRSRIPFAPFIAVGTMLAVLVVGRGSFGG